MGLSLMKLGGLSKNKSIKIFEKDWYSLMTALDEHNEEGYTFTLIDVKRDINCGYQCKIYAPIGLELECLSEIIEYIESVFRCRFNYIIDSNQEYANAQFKFMKVIGGN